MSQDSKFECRKCGICCRRIGNNPAAKGTELESFDRGDGVCKHLTADNLCDIYEVRPLVCRVDELYYKFYKDTMTIEEYHEMQRNACEFLRKTSANDNRRKFGL